MSERPMLSGCYVWMRPIDFHPYPFPPLNRTSTTAHIRHTWNRTLGTHGIKTI